MQLSIIISIGLLPRFHYFSIFKHTLKLLNKELLGLDSFELVIADYGSKDTKCLDVLLSKYPKISSNHVIISSKDGKWWGAKCKNVGVSKAKGDNILLLHPDDWLSPGSLLFSLKELQKNPNVCYVGRRYDLSENYTKQVLKNKVSVESVFDAKKYIIPHSVKAQGDFQLMSKRLYWDVGGYDERFKEWGFDDLDFVDCVREKGHTVVRLDKPDFFMIHAYHVRDKSNKGQNNILYKKKRQERNIRRGR